MATTQYYTATSIDGFIADEHNSLDWLFEQDSGDDNEDRFRSFMAAVGAIAMGSTTYEWVLNHEHILDDPAKWRIWYGDTPAWVFSHRELPPIPGADIRFVSGDVRPVHQAMTATAGDANIWLIGGGDLVGQFADHGLLDELILGIAPVMLGAGAPLLPRRLTGLRLAETRRAGTMIELRYSLTGRETMPE
ncbi:dihydrofolate reductase family protein [soil metagenome]